MKRLDYTRRIRTLPGHARNAAETILLQLQIVFERQRLEQERRSLERRLRTIDTRLTAIGGATPAPQPAAVAAAPLRPPQPATFQY
jgi:hypothetical protein